MAALQDVVELPLPIGGNEKGPGITSAEQDLSDRGPGGARFVYSEGANLVPKEDESARRPASLAPPRRGLSGLSRETSFPGDAKKDKRADTDPKIRKK